MTDLVNLIMGADLNETLCNIVAIIFIIEFIGCIFGLLGGFSRK